MHIRRSSSVSLDLTVLDPTPNGFNESFLTESKTEQKSDQIGFIQHTKEKVRKYFGRILKKRRTKKEKGSSFFRAPSFRRNKPHPKVEDVGDIERARTIVHVSLDPTNTETGLKGLTTEMKLFLQMSGYNKEMLLNDPENALEIIKFYMRGGPPKLPTRQTLKKMQDGALEIRQEDPNTILNLKNSKSIGEGSVGKVTLCSLKGSKVKVAVKMSRITKDTPLEELFNEVSLQSLSLHDNIVRTTDCFLFEQTVYLVMEWMDGGSLTNLLHKRFPFSERFIGYVAKSVAKGLAYLHRNYHLHRDIKSDNIFFSNRGQIKLGDFGFAVSLTADRTKRKTKIGTTYWMAPEQLQCNSYGPEVDIYAFGITCIEMAEGEPPDFNLLPLEFLLKLKDLSKPPSLMREDKWSDNFQHFIYRSLSLSPDKRPSAEQCLLHPFLKKTCSVKTFVKFLHIQKAKLKTVKYKKKKKPQVILVDKPNISL